MRKWIIAGVILITFVVILFAAFLNINSLISRNKDYLISQAQEVLGRKISVGEVEATLFSGVGARLTSFTMSDDPDYAAGDFVRAKNLQIHLKFWPLLKKELQVQKVVLHDPVIRIIRNDAGKFNFSSIGKKDKQKKQPVEKEKRERVPQEEGQTAFLVSLIDI